MNSGGLHFDQMKTDAKRKLQVLLPTKDSNNCIVSNSNVDCIAWEDFADGNACYDPLRFETEEEAEIDALWLAAVRTAMPYGSNTHLLLMPEVARSLGNHWVTYDWLSKACSKLFACCTLYELTCMLELSHKLRAVNNWVPFNRSTKAWYDHFFI